MEHRSTTIAVGGNVSGVVVVGNNNVVCDYSGTTIGPARPPVVRLTTPRSLLWRERDAPVGRDAELRAVNTHLDARRHVQVYGQAGYGKSLLLTHVSRDRASRDHVICLSVNGKPIDDVMQDMFEACYESHEEYRPTPVRLRRLLEPIRALLVLDHLSNDPRDIEHVLDTTSGCTVLSGARERTLWSAGRAVPLGDLSPEASLALVRRILGREPTAAELRQVHAANGCPPALLRIGAIEVDHRHRRVIRVLALLGATACSVALIALLAGIASAEAEPVLADLERVGLITSSGGGFRISMRSGEITSASSAAAVLTDWLWSGPARHEIIEAAPVIVAVLSAAGPTAEALALARIAAPTMVRALRLGAWGQVLRFGAEAADLLGAADEIGYFRRELVVREQLLEERPHPRLLWKILVPLLLLASLAGFGWVALSAPGDPDAQPSTSASNEPSPITTPATDAATREPTSGLTGTPTDPRTSTESCVLSLPASHQFDSAGDGLSVPILAQPCHTSGIPTSMTVIEGPDAAAFTLEHDCPGVLPAGETCTATIYFDATEPGTYTARLVIPDEPPMTLSGLIKGTTSSVMPPTTTTKSTTTTTTKPTTTTITTPG